MAYSSEVTSVRIPRDLYASLKTLAKVNHRSINGEATVAVERYVKAEEKKAAR